MDFKAYKMDGLGNDFVIIDQREKKYDLNDSQIKKICDRGNIGCDQLILINKSDKFDAFLTFKNSDGSDSAACGNGTRCVASLLSKENSKNLITVETSSGKLESKILDNNLIQTNIGKPKTNWDQIPLSEKIDTKKIRVKVGDIEFLGTAINVGNPHIIFFINELEKIEIEKVGPIVENHELFPEKVNVTFAKEQSKNHFKVLHWERGAGLTKACGTAACATAVAANINELTDKTTDIEFALGRLSISIDENNSIHMKGPVSDIKNIEINI